MLAQSSSFPRRLHQRDNHRTPRSSCSRDADLLHRESRPSLLFAPRTMEDGRSSPPPPNEIEKKMMEEHDERLLSVREDSTVCERPQFERMDSVIAETIPRCGTCKTRLVGYVHGVKLVKSGTIDDVESITGESDSNYAESSDLPAGAVASIHAFMQDVQAEQDARDAQDMQDAADSTLGEPIIINADKSCEGSERVDDAASVSAPPAVVLVV